MISGRKKKLSLATREPPHQRSAHMPSVERPSQINPGAYTTQELKDCSSPRHTLASQPPNRQLWRQCRENQRVLLMDVITDPDTRVALLQAQGRNMRSKCRCSCVLQFTLCHAFSCVLHRPPSQLIHCIVLCFGFLRQGKKLKETKPFHAKLSREGSR